ncbi:MAG: hypothetical protein KAF91_15390 [Nostoc sp. TH1S01]|nr:hypothetical protein [Nostoc sp. TH1S01]
MKDKELSLWANLRRKEMGYLQARALYLKGTEPNDEIFRSALRNPSERGTALRLIKDCYTLEQKKQILRELLELSRCDHSDLQLTWEIILSMPREYVLSKIEEWMDWLIPAPTEKEQYVVYRSLLALFIHMDENITYRLAKRAKEDTDEDVKEAGEDYLQLLKRK